MVSPASAGLSIVMGAPARLAQHKVVLVAVSVTEPAPATPVVTGVATLTGTAEVGVAAVDVAEIGIVSPSGPGTFARKRIAVYAAAALAVTTCCGSALIREISASRMLARVSVLSTT